MPILNKSFTIWESKAEPTRAELSQQQRAQDLITTRLELPFSKLVAKIINKYTNRIASKAAEFGKDVFFAQEILALNGELLPEFGRQYSRTANVFERDFVESLSKSWRIPETKDQGGIFNASLLQYINDNAAEQVQHVTETTKVIINSAIQQAVEEGLGPFEMAKIIRLQSGGLIALHRSRTIARTETHSAAQFGQQAASESVGLEFRKYWVEARDERTRHDHILAGRDSRDQVIKNNEPFSVGGEALMYPGDPSGSPEQIINCRCGAVRRPIL